jgi:serine protease AprX
VQIGVIALLVAVAGSVLAPSAFAAGGSAKFSEKLNRIATGAPGSQTTSIIVRFTGAVPPEFKEYARPARPDDDGWYVLDVRNDKLKTIAEHSSTISAMPNDTVRAFNFRTGVQGGAFFVGHAMGLTGKGVGVAVLDSGLAPNNEVGPVYFKDFIDPTTPGEMLCNTPSTPCDPNGHGTHIIGTIAGNGYNSNGERAGMAPDASIIALRVLGKDGTGSLAGVLSALDWVWTHRADRAYNIRVVNLSFGTVPDGSLPDQNPLATMLDNDLLAVKTKRLVDAGIFVVAAAGNVGQVDCSMLEHPSHRDKVTHKCDVWGGITAPGTYPWVFTAGAASSMGSFTRRDDTRAAFSSRGPAFPLQNAKPDMLAGAVGVESTSAPGSTLYLDAGLQGYLLDGGSYMALSGTSQAAAVVSGVAAQMLQANRRLTPNFMKAILQYTSQEYAGYTPLEQGAGFLNALGAAQLSRFYATARAGQRVPVSPIWSQHFIWGNHELSGGLMLPKANAWDLGVMWGMPKVNGYTGDNIVWGTACGDADCGDNIVWGTASNDDNIVWGTADDDNIVWGTVGDGDNIVWGTAAGDDNIVWGTACGGQDCGDNIVWGTAGEGDNIVWGTAGLDDNIVWGTANAGDNIVWGTAADGSDNIVWGTLQNGDNIVWGTFDDNIVWGTFDDNILWGTAANDNIVWGTVANDNIVWGTVDDNIVWGTSLGGKKGGQSVTLDYQWFLDPNHAALWIRQEFGDTFLISR